ncbi:MAG: hypothetical protein IJE09_02265 [Oscillospiraceae bacterium]|nr:hypothetical protein [Oscillospiraceae bacterium]
MKKMLMMAVAVILVVVISVSATLAYLTDTDDVVNTFTVGKVDITLTEKEDTDNDGKHTFEDIVPGHKYDKTPVVTVKADSEKCYVFVKVENGLKDVETTVAADTIDGQIRTNWTALAGYAGVYYKVVEETTADTPITVFSSFTVNGEKTNTEMDAVDGKEIKVTAYAVQFDGMADAAAAWKVAQGANKYGA